MANAAEPGEGLRVVSGEPPAAWWHRLIRWYFPKHQSISNPLSISATQQAALVAYLKNRCEKKSSIYPGHSIHFERFPPRPVEVPDGFSCDYLGSLWPLRFGFTPFSGVITPQIPPLSEEYFEVLDIFESVIDAEGTFTMLEWGAGFGRWTSLGVAAARDQGIADITVGLVEAHPLHISYIEENLQLMNMPKAKAKIFPFALGGSNGTELFIIEQPLDQKSEHHWFGQALASSAGLTAGFEETSREYHGLPVILNPEGWAAIKVSIDTASKVLEVYEFVDLIDMDLQGAEADVVRECIVQLNAKVRRLHIGTHGDEIEQQLRQILTENGWVLLRDLAVHADTETSYGIVHCVDGVQSWYNLRFPPSGLSQD